MKVTEKYEVQPSRGMYGPDGWRLVKTNTCECCGNKKTQFIARFEEEDAANQYLDFITAHKTNREQ